MDIKIENGKIIFSENNIEYSFDAHGEYARPSLMPAIIVGGKHLSNRSDDIKIEKHTAVQDVAIGNNMAAWYGNFAFSLFSKKNYSHILINLTVIKSLRNQRSNYLSAFSCVRKCSSEYFGLILSSEI